MPSGLPLMFRRADKAERAPKPPQNDTRMWVVQVHVLPTPGFSGGSYAPRMVRGEFEARRLAKLLRKDFPKNSVSVSCELAVPDGVATG